MVGLPLVAIGQPLLVSVVAGALACATPQVVGVPLGYVLVCDDHEPLLLRTMFDGQPEKLTYFLNQVWNYLELYGAVFPDKGPV